MILSRICVRWVILPGTNDKYKAEEYRYEYFEENVESEHQLLKNMRNLVHGVRDNSHHNIWFGVLQHATEKMSTFPEAIKHGDEPCAVYYSRGETVYIVYIHIPDRLQRQGIGRQLVSLMKEIAVGEGAHQLKVTLQACIAQAGPFYKALGFLSSTHCHTKKAFKQDNGSGDELTLFISERRPTRGSSPLVLVKRDKDVSAAEGTQLQGGETHSAEAQAPWSDGEDDDALTLLSGFAQQDSPAYPTQQAAATPCVEALNINALEQVGLKDEANAVKVWQEMREEAAHSVHELAAKLRMRAGGTEADGQSSNTTLTQSDPSKQRPNTVLQQRTVCVKPRCGIRV